MKIKLIILFIFSSLLIFIIYNHNYRKTINLVSINSLYENENYNKYISDLLNKSKVKYNYNIDFTNTNMEIENLISKIDNDEKKIKNIIHEADVIILSIGNIDYKTEEMKTIINELELLFKKIRLINSKQVFYISPSIIKNTFYIKELCRKYNIIYYNGSSFRNKNNLLAQIIYKKIDSVYIKENDQ